MSTKQTDSSNLILVRHGETETNRARRFAASPNGELTELGRQQAREAAARIARLFEPKLIVSSPYLRARQTAGIIAAEFALAVEVHDALYEQQIGYLDGQPWETLLKDPSWDPKRSWLWRPAGGESHADVRLRVGPVLDQIAAANRGRDVVVVSHGWVMKALWAHVLDDWEQVRELPNAAILAVEHQAGGYAGLRLVTE